MSIAKDYAALRRLRHRSGDVMVLCTGWVYRWCGSGWVFVRAACA